MSFEEFEKNGASPLDPSPIPEVPAEGYSPESEPFAAPDTFGPGPAPDEAAAPQPTPGIERDSAWDLSQPIEESPVEESPAEEVPAGEQPAGQPEGAYAPPRPVQPYDVDGDERRDWSEPMYESAPAADPDAYTPGRYAYGAQNVQPAQEEPPKKKEKKRHGFLRAACLVLVCALVSAFSSWAVVDYMFDHRANTLGGNQVVFGSSLGSVTEDLEPSGPVVPGTELTGTQIYKLACKQVVGVNTSLTTNAFGQTSTRAVSGSGFFISEDGYILTNYHVISYAVVYGGELTVMTQDGTKYPATIIGYLESNDVAVIKVDGQGFSPVAIGNIDNMEIGEWVYAVGNPLGELAYSMTPGIISAQDRMITTRDDITGSQTSINMFQISAAVNAGNSGGPVYNQRGEVIGIVSAKYADEGIEGLGFAIPINDAISIATQLVEKGYVAGAGLGITGMNVDSFYTQFTIERYNIPSGVYVESVNPGSAAEAAGIHPKDIIIALGDKTVTSMDELKLALRRSSPGDTSTITVYRMDDSMTGGSTYELDITFQELVEENTAQQQQQQQQQYPGFGWPFG